MTNPAKGDLSSSEAPYSFIAYFDEAGDPGIKRVTPIDPNGATEWFSVGCAVMQAHRESEPVEFIKRLKTEFRSHQRPDIHYKHLKPWQRVMACQELAKENVRLFALVSNKQSMRGYRNKNAEALSQHPNDYFYNYCIRIMLERLTEYLHIKSNQLYGEPRKALMVFSKRGGHSYRHVETYTKLLGIQKRNGNLYQSVSSPDFEIFDPTLINVIQHEQNAGLQMADIVASAFYQAAHARAPGWDTQPAEALKPRVATVKSRYADKGLQLLPWRTWTNHPLTSDQKKIFQFYGYKL